MKHMDACSNCQPVVRKWPSGPPKYTHKHVHKHKCTNRKQQDELCVPEPEIYHKSFYGIQISDIAMQEVSLNESYTELHVHYEKLQVDGPLQVKVNTGAWNTPPIRTYHQMYIPTSSILLWRPIFSIYVTTIYEYT